MDIFRFNNFVTFRLQLRFYMTDNMYSKMTFIEHFFFLFLIKCFRYSSPRHFPRMKQKRLKRKCSFTNKNRVINGKSSEDRLSPNIFVELSVLINSLQPTSDILLKLTHRFILSNFFHKCWREKGELERRRKDQKKGSH